MSSILITTISPSAMEMTTRHTALNSTSQPVHIRPATFNDLSALAEIDAQAFKDDEYFAWLCPYRTAHPCAFRRFMYRMLVWRMNFPSWRTWVAYTISSASPSPKEDRVLGYIMAQRLGMTATAYAWYQDTWLKYMLRLLCFLITALIHLFRLDPCMSHSSYLKSTQHSPPEIFPADFERFHIQQLSVLPAAQGRGVGTKLYAFVKSVAEREEAAVTLESSHVAQKFYRARGCVDVGRVVLDEDSGLWAAVMVSYSSSGKVGEVGKKVRWIGNLERGVDEG